MPKIDNIQPILPDEVIVNKIFVIRGMKVMIDEDLAELYDVEIRRLNEQVKRNIERFPEDFMFQLAEKEIDTINSLRSQNATLKSGRGKHRKYLPYVFTEHGVLMLSSVLNSYRAIKTNIQIIRIFNKMRELLSTNKEILQKLEKKDIEQDQKIMLIFEYLKQLEQTKQQDTELQHRSKIGFKK